MDKMNAKASPLNYAAQAERALLMFMILCDQRGLKNDAAIIQSLLLCISKSAHFCLPYGGTLFDDNLRGLQNQRLRLPFPHITIEYYISEKDQPELGDLEPVPKRLIIAAEVTKEEYARYENWLVNALLLGDASRWCEGFVLVWGINGFRNGTWVPDLAGGLIPTKWDDPTGATPVPSYPGTASNGRYRFSCSPVVLLETYRFLHPDVPAEAQICDDDRIAIMHDVGVAFAPLAELCEALTCENVSTEFIQRVRPEVNRRRTQGGKLPLYDIKTLTVTVPTTRISKEKPATHDDRNSPRQHLRRGHIRNIGIGRSVWVNSCVVGKAATGRIEKRYLVDKFSACPSLNT